MFANDDDLKDFKTALKEIHQNMNHMIHQLKHKIGEDEDEENDVECEPEVDEINEIEQNMKHLINKMEQVLQQEKEEEEEEEEQVVVSKDDSSKKAAEFKPQVEHMPWNVWRENYVHKLEGFGRLQHVIPRIKNIKKRKKENSKKKTRKNTTFLDQSVDNRIEIINSTLNHFIKAN